GAPGFVGAHVGRALAADPRVAAVSCPGRDRHDLVRGDAGELVELMLAEKPDAVVNCTGRLTGSGYDLVLANTAVTAKLIDAVAAAAPHARLVRLGSAGEYGPVAGGRPVTENDLAQPR